MKKRIVLSCILLASSIAIIGGPAIFAQGKNRTVVITPKRITLSGAEITKEDWKAVNNILKQCGDNSLYKIQSFDKGKPKGEPQGTMSDMFLDRKMESKMAEDARVRGLSNWSFLMDGTESNPTPPPGKCTGKELVRRLAPIFKKYSK
jgi:hypothetical protein